MNPLRTVGGRLALALLVVVAGALAIVYVVVVPSYQRSLVNARLNGLGQSLTAIVKLPRLPDGTLDQAWAEDTAYPLADARVVVLGYLCCPALLDPIADWPARHLSRDVVDDPIALRALRHPRRVVRGVVTRNETSYAEAAYALGPQGRVVLLSSSLQHDLTSVGVVQRRVLVAGGIATAFAILLGYGLATLFARRIRRLEAAAERIADGRFDLPVVDDAPDELGQLARAFDRMRLQLASLDRARRDFIANASHELRTPLFSLGGFLELLAGEELDPETTAEFLLETREQVSRLQKLATDLLDLSRLDAESLTVARESFDLAAIGEVLERELRARAEAAAHELRLERGGPVPAIGDEDRALQIGRALVDNAIVHTPAGTTVVIRAALDRGRATLSVVDDGPGIPLAAQTHVFERFYRLAGTVAPGSGLGLAIASELARLMGGRIALESRPGSTRFTLELPADVLESPPPSPLPAEERPRAGSRRIAQV